MAGGHQRHKIRIKIHINLASGSRVGTWGHTHTRLAGLICHFFFHDVQRTHTGSN
jgi:hypothetical protein